MSEKKWENATVRKWFPEKGYGFVVSDDHPGEDAFLHVTKIPEKHRGRISEGASVKVVTARDKKGLRVMTMDF